MNDNTRGLLELAAKAAGDGAQWAHHDPFRLYAMILPSGQSWNPLDDDGDCARLEAALYASVTIGSASVEVAMSGHGEIGCAEEFYEGHAGSRTAARRLASVRAAAEIGRMMG